MDAPSENMAIVPNQQPNINQTPKNSKRNNRNGRQNAQHMHQTDGTMSDSVTNPIATPNSKKPSRRVHSGAVPTIPSMNGAMSSKNGTKTRPISIGGGARPSTPSKEQAYAGPTFQASPAPSSLPVPKFFSPSGSRTASHKQSIDESFARDRVPNSDEVPENPIASPEPPERSVQQSPLDVFFKADKAEKERRRTSSTLSPGISFRRTASANETYTLPRQTNANSYGQNIHAANRDNKIQHDLASPQRQHKPGALHSQPTPVSDDDQAMRDAYTKSLKDLLFNVTGSAPSPPASPPSHTIQSRSHARQPPSQDAPRLDQESTTEAQVPSGEDARNQSYSLHYGDRNLSSLFKAAQSEAAPQAPIHRQQESANQTSTVASSDPTFPFTQPTNDPSDASMVSRRYLDQTIKEFHTGNSHASSPGPGTHYPNKAHSSHRSTHSNFKQERAANSTAPPPTIGAKDVNAMESELRRALNMHIFKD